MRHLEFLAPAVAALVLVACAGTPESPSTTVGSTYACESGALIQASYPDTDHARIEYQGRTHVLAIAVSASGARYVGDGFEWWTKGSGPGSSGSLYQHLPDGTTGDAIETCTAQ